MFLHEAHRSFAHLRPMRTITLEEHFVTESFVKATETPGHSLPAPIAQLRPKLLDLGAGRIAAMDEAGIDFQVLSLASMGLDALAADVATDLIRDVNDELAAAIKANPTRLGGFAALALRDPKAAAKELERSITRLGFCGVLLDGTTAGLFLDDPSFLPVWEAAASLRIRCICTLPLRRRRFARSIIPGCPEKLACCSPLRDGDGTPKLAYTHCV
jgi:predicted TIM-barrel fold metal-dependent hydrolase